jgi:mono/diheme cytochrome c family protein
VIKRTWMILVSALALAMLVSACGSSQLAEELTPVPTLAPGETPALVEALGQAPTEEPAGEDDGEAEGEGGEDALVAAGEELFTQTCAGCHGAQDGAGPALTGMADRAATRVEGMSAEDYLHESIVDPSAHVVEGFQDIMPKNYDEQFDDQQIDSLVAYIMSAGSEGGAADDAEATEEAAEDAEGEADGAAAAGDAAAGGELFAQNCAGCHGDADGAGPARVGMGERAATRVEGMSAEDYLHESIVDPSAHVVEGFSDIMPKQYGEQFSEEQIANLIAYMLEQ